MHNSEMIIYPIITSKINEYQLEHKSKPRRIRMSENINKRLVKEISNSDAVLSIEVVFGLNIEIDNEMFDCEIIILGQKNGSKKKSKDGN